MTLAATLALIASPLVVVDPAHAATLITGSGSSWSSNLVNQDVADVTQAGDQVVYTAVGSAAGRQDFTNRTTDFGVTDLPYQGTDPVTSAVDSNCTNPADTTTCRLFRYAPMAGGAVVLAYNLTLPGHGVLRLSPATTARIFSGSILWWDDAAVSVDNPGLSLPHTGVTPVVHNEGSVASRVLTSYLSHRAPAQWTSAPTSYFPSVANGVGQSGSDGVVNYIAGAAAEGTIGYVEVSYALAKGLPLAKMLNAGGYYATPTAGSSALALRSAGVATDGSALLDPVFDAPDPRVYPLSYYSYLIIPTSATDVRMTTAKRAALARFVYYAACTGQFNAAPLGYTPLPVNLSALDMDAIAALGAADPAVDISQLTLDTCHEPTFVTATGQSILESVVSPARACDKAGTGSQCDVAPSSSSAVVARAGAASASVSWRAPSVTGGLTLTYRVTAVPGGRSCTSAVLHCVVPGLANGHTYRFSVTATNMVGAGPRSGFSNAVVPHAAASAPRHLVVTYPGRGRARVAWAAPMTAGGLRIDRYLVRWSSNGGRTWTSWTSVAASRVAGRAGLARRHAYTMQVRAVTAVGAGAVAPIRFTQAR